MEKPLLKKSPNQPSYFVLFESDLSVGSCHDRHEIFEAICNITLPNHCPDHLSGCQFKAHLAIQYKVDGVDHVLVSPADIMPTTHSIDDEPILLSPEMFRVIDSELALSPIVASNGVMMRFSPSTGHRLPSFLSVQDYRQQEGQVAWLFNPFNGTRRDLRDVASDPTGLLIAPTHADFFISQTDYKHIVQFGSSLAMGVVAEEGSRF